jgi:hypothetical protein
MNDAQIERLEELGGDKQIVEVPPGSLLVVRAPRPGARPTWFEIVEPVPTYRYCWDVSGHEPVR